MFTLILRMDRGGIVIPFPSTSSGIKSGSLRIHQWSLYSHLRKASSVNPLFTISQMESPFTDGCSDHVSLSRGTGTASVPGMVSRANCFFGAIDNESKEVENTKDLACREET